MVQVHKLVEEALSTWEETRNSDKKLMLAVWHLQNPDYVDNFKTFFKEKAISPETITRCRRKLQEQGMYLASEKVDQERFNKFNQMRNYTNTLQDISKTLN